MNKLFEIRKSFGNKIRYYLSIKEYDADCVSFDIISNNENDKNESNIYKYLKSIYKQNITKKY